MSEVSATHLTREPEPNEPDPQIQTCTRWCFNHNCNPFADDPVDPRSSDAGWFSDTASDSDRDVSCFFTDLFDRRTSDHQQQPSGCVLVPGSDPFATELEIGGLDGGEDVGSNLGLGFGVESNSQDSVSELGELVAPQGADSNFGGLRVVGLESDSDSDSDNNNDIESDRVNEGIQSIWDNLMLDEQRNMYENSEWEEVEQSEEHVEDNPIEGEVEELSMASGFSTEEEEVPEGAARSLEWEILFTVNNFHRNIDDVDIETAEYIEAIFGQFMENASALKGSPPAALSAVEALPFVVFTAEELRRDEVVCAVCKDNIVLEDKARSLPCCHYYHEDCIVPWLQIRNTCPVCRYELPTDDPDYERNKCVRAARGIAGDSRVRFHFGFDFQQFV